MPKNNNEWRLLFSTILLSHLAGAIGSFFTFESITNWYATLILPSYAPPDWIFGPVWGVLYTLMGIALYIVWKQHGLAPAQARVRDTGIALFILQLTFNGLWSIIFFGAHSPLYALIDIVVLDIVVIVTALFFYRVQKVAAYLLVPYVIWIGFATALNLSIVLLNA